MRAVYPDPHELENSVVIESTPSRGYNLSADGKFLGTFDDWDEANDAAEEWMESNQYWPNKYHVNERGSVDLLDQEGRFVDVEWVESEDDLAVEDFEFSGLDARHEEMLVHALNTQTNSTDFGVYGTPHTLSWRDADRSFLCSALARMSRQNPDEEEWENLKYLVHCFDKKKRDHDLESFEFSGANPHLDESFVLRADPGTDRTHVTDPDGSVRTFDTWDDAVEALEREDSETKRYYHDYQTNNYFEVDEHGVVIGEPLAFSKPVEDFEFSGLERQKRWESLYKSWATEDLVEEGLRLGPRALRKREDPAWEEENDQYYALLHELGQRQDELEQLQLDEILRSFEFSGLGQPHRIRQDVAAYHRKLERIRQEIAEDLHELAIKIKNKDEKYSKKEVAEFKREFDRLKQSAKVLDESKGGPRKLPGIPPGFEFDGLGNATPDFMDSDDFTSEDWEYHPAYEEPEGYEDAFQIYVKPTTDGRFYYDIFTERPDRSGGYEMDFSTDVVTDQGPFDTRKEAFQTARAHVERWLRLKGTPDWSRRVRDFEFSGLSEDEERMLVDEKTRIRRTMDYLAMQIHEQERSDPSWARDLERRYDELEVELRDINRRLEDV